MSFSHHGGPVRAEAVADSFEPARSAAEAVDRLSALYTRAVEALRSALKIYLDGGPPPSGSARAAGMFAYPELRITYLPDGPVPPLSRAYGKFSESGIYTQTVTHPELFREYLTEQISLLQGEYDVLVETGVSTQEIPFSYVLDGAQELDMDGAAPAELVRHFPYADLSQIDDALPNGERPSLPRQPRPLSLFDGARTDYSLQRIRHYTGTPFEDVQGFILFTNYHRYVDAFVAWAAEQLKADGPYESLSAAGFVHVDANTDDPVSVVESAPWRRFQMPAYHLKAPGRRGITLVNIGVGPSNAKNITDHLAVLRPECWLMIGHCGGLRHSQRLGDYVLAHAYLRYDAVLDRDLPVEIPIPAIAEIQIALQDAVKRVSGDKGEALKRRLRTGTVVTHADRNWELRYLQEARRINQSRSIAVDMESATIAANGFRLRVPYGTLLCVSDKPLHGELKLPGAANRFYNKAVSEHLMAGIETIEILKAAGSEALHSRKLRSFDEPPFR
ncbi:MAG: AMP nucleosidase [Oceanicaulis sp.]|uniref:AMP nucleosidase n=1 Tax=Glycocaulis sp. TaxID=1969725 RepID=UPI0025B98810|nr:AMP nucleosidase [Glycocaulis sp.]MCC5981591.1 AMP nucleosidase [Oceanicaulis sp.]MCH8522327.1 AMP nucleosidase [Glycocaulis sp.]